MFLPFSEGFYIHENKTLAKFSEFTVYNNKRSFLLQRKSHCIFSGVCKLPDILAQVKDRDVKPEDLSEYLDGNITVKPV